jgi:hypothetical protein
LIFPTDGFAKKSRSFVNVTFVLYSAMLVTCISYLLAVVGGGSAVAHYVPNRKVADSIPDEVNEFFFSTYLTLQAALGLGIHLTSNGNEYQKQKNTVSGGVERCRCARNDILIANCGPIF